VTGLATPDTIMAELGGFAAVPRVVTILAPGWQHFMGRADADAIFRNGIGMCRLTELSEDTVWEALKFGDHGDRFVFVRLGAQHTLAAILPPPQGGTFLIAPLTSSMAMNVFTAICSNLGFEQVSDPHGLHREIGLLSMVGPFGYN
jgi:hypothetical protein